MDLSTILSAIFTGLMLGVLGTLVYLDRKDKKLVKKLKDDNYLEKIKELNTTYKEVENARTARNKERRTKRGATLKRTDKCTSSEGKPKVGTGVQIPNPINVRKDIKRVELHKPSAI